MSATTDLFLSQWRGRPPNGLHRGTRERLGRVYFALKPEPDLAAHVVSVGNRLRARHRLIGRVSPAVLHVSICGIGYLPELSDERIDAACEVAGELAAQPFEIILDRIRTYPNGPGKAPLVAFAENGAPRVRLFQRALIADLRRRGFTLHTRSSQPHMTLFYDRCIVAEEPIDAIRWMVRDFVLVHSIHGEGRHVLLGQWPLRS